ncbi:hypothetical protein GXP74_37670 [Streptacidiphilus sp. P02-A3a]|nr:hypothetical protein GXP74_37670 [Streptacidiphilus sp. P02-A3a]
MEPDRAESFARTTQLSRSEVGNLLTSAMGTRYGPLNTELTPRGSAATMAYGNPWLLTRTPRYCPQCLAGDGSEIQELHGGAWRRNWMLPPVFACPRHRRLLRVNCPSCLQPVNGAQKGSIIARLWDDDLHPTQCRTTRTPLTIGRLQPACGTELSESAELIAGSPCDEHTLKYLLGLQERLLHLLDPTGPDMTPSVGWLVPVAHYFADLRALLGLVFLTWPAARHLAGTPALTTVLDEEAQQRRARAEDLHTRPGKKYSSRPYTDPPVNPLLMGAVLGIAMSLLDADDEVLAIELLTPLVRQAYAENQALANYLRRESWISYPLRIVIMNRSRGTAPPDKLIGWGPSPAVSYSAPCPNVYLRRSPRPSSDAASTAGWSPT